MRETADHQSGLFPEIENQTKAKIVNKAFLVKITNLLLDFLQSSKRISQSLTIPKVNFTVEDLRYKSFTLS